MVIQQHKTNVNDSPPYQPKVILQRLGLSATHDLDSILADSCSLLPPMKGVPEVGRGALPPFPWSLSHTGPSKPVVDTGKSTPGRSSSQGKWVRIGSHPCLMGEERSSFPELDLKMGDHTQDPVPKRASGFLSCSSPSMATSLGPSTPREPALLMGVGTVGVLQHLGDGADAMGRSLTSIRIRGAMEPPARDAQNHGGRNHGHLLKSSSSRSAPLEGSHSGELLLYRSIWPTVWSSPW